MSSVQKQWPRILAEGAAIVVSILLAFAIDARWDLSQERERAAAILSSLDVAYSESLATMEVGVLVIEGDLAALDRFLTLDLDAARTVPPDSAGHMIQSIWRPGPPWGNPDYLLALLDAESLNSLNDQALQEAISRWRTTLRSILNRYDQQLAPMEREAKRALARHAEIRPVLMRVGESPHASSAALVAALQDDDVMALATTKANDWRIHLLLLNNLRAHSETVRGLIQEAADR